MAKINDKRDYDRHGLCLSELSLDSSSMVRKERLYRRVQDLRECTAEEPGQGCGAELREAVSYLNVPRRRRTVFNSLHLRVVFSLDCFLTGVW